MKILFIGDTHAHFDGMDEIARWAAKLIYESGKGYIDRIVQVGDFGIWPGYAYHQDLFPVEFIDGNHENFEILKNGDYKKHFDAVHIPRGTIKNGILFVGGATSIDKSQRMKGWDWFEEENISTSDEYRILDAIDSYGAEIRAVVAHDAPWRVYPSVVHGIKADRETDPNARVLDNIFDLVKPKIWVHGHHHHAKRYESDDCKFISLDMAGGPRMEGHKVIERENEILACGNDPEKMKDWINRCAFVYDTETGEEVKI